MDLFSELPEHLIHSILRLLPTKDLTRMSILSKSWKSIHQSFPVLDIKERDFIGKQRLFEEFIQSSFQKKLDVEIFRWKILPFCPLSNYGSIFDQLIGFMARASSLKEVSLLFVRRKDFPPLQLSTIIASNTLTTLSLYGIGLDKSIIIDLPNLQNLMLIDIELHETTLDKFISGCPLLEYLEIQRCEIQGEIKIVSPKLKKFVLNLCAPKEIAIVETASPLAVEYIVNKLPFYSVGSSHLLEVNFKFIVRYWNGTIWWDRLKELFAKTNHIKDMKMAIVDLQDQSSVIIHDDPFMRGFWWNILCNLRTGEESCEVSITSKGWNDYYLCSGLFKTIYVASSSHNSNKVCYSKLIEKHQCQGECYYKSERCLDVKLEDLTLTKDNEVALLKPYQAFPCKITRFSHLGD